jgi:hypothetical protein
LGRNVGLPFALGTSSHSWRLRSSLVKEEIYWAFRVTTGCRFGYEWCRTTFITVPAMDLEPSEWFILLHWFMLHRQTPLHTSLLWEREYNVSASWVSSWWAHWILCLMILLPMRVGFHDKRHRSQTRFSTPSVNKFDKLVITQSSQFS